MSNTVFFSFVLFLGSQWGAEPHSIPVTEGVVSSFSSSSRHFEEDLAKLFDEILLQVFPSNLDDLSKDARTAGRDANETRVLPNSFNHSEFASSSHLAQLFDEILLQVLSNDPMYLSKEDARAADELVTWRDVNENLIAEKVDKESSLFNRDVSHQLSTVDKEIPQVLVTQDVYTEGLPCRELLSFLEKNIITVAAAIAAILLVTAFVVLALVTYKRQKQPRYPPANTTYNIFIMNGKAWWQNPEERYLRKFTGKQKHLKCNSFV
uniref:uncharacterized protein C2orf92 homolog isoform X2 n=1 Tax=Myodes glareolus TaxID=447135 RepID=UPI0020225339|nr:uncharacterized protein C2orf92 homolog isoform X2 [Myodes glareolus]